MFLGLLTQEILEEIFNKNMAYGQKLINSTITLNSNLNANH